MLENKKKEVLQLAGVSEDFIKASDINDFSINEILKDIMLQNENLLYSDTLIRVIIMSSQEFEALMREYISKNEIQFAENIWRKESGKLLAMIEKLGGFSDGQIRILRNIIKLRNWVVHEIYQERDKYDKNHSSVFETINRCEWNKYYNSKLALTKFLIYEAIDLFAGATSIIAK